MTTAVDCYIGVGSNMGNRRGFCEEAVRKLGEFPGSDVETVSSVYETAPMERSDQDWFINCVVKLRTTLSPQELLKACQGVEQFLGRKRTLRFGPRTIDLDVLFYGDRVIHEASLTIPHPRLHERRFVLEPLAEIAPDFKHPLLKKSPGDLLSGIAGQTVNRLGPFNQEEQEQ
ncbi:MAG TPA: 2-amino-4-hydroxy-6-hydroxymethyldihydropteridine diphosphokinase [Nitrospiria bacterium]